MASDDIARQLEQQLTHAQEVVSNGDSDTYGVGGPSRGRILEELIGLELQPLSLGGRKYDLQVQRDAQGIPHNEMGSRAVVSVTAYDG